MADITPAELEEWLDTPEGREWHTQHFSQTLGSGLYGFRHDPEETWDGCSYHGYGSSLEWWEAELDDDNDKFWEGKWFISMREIKENIDPVRV